MKPTNVTPQTIVRVPASVAFPVRVLATPFQPNLARDVHCAYIIDIAITDPALAMNASVNLNVAQVNPPLAAHASTGYLRDADAGVDFAQVQTISAIVPRGWWANLAIVVNTNAVITLVQSIETVLL